jgi:flagellar biogenesis protein FliO
VCNTPLSEFGVIMPIEKIAIVVIFLLALILLQLVIKYRGKVVQTSFPKASNINVNARLNLSKTERADLISVGSQSFMVIFTKGNSPSIVELTSDNRLSLEPLSE